MLGAGTAPLATFLAACADGGGSAPPTSPRPPGTTATSTAATSAPTTPAATTQPAALPGTTTAVDPDIAWWLQGNFAPVFDEVETFELSVRGAIPPELNGLYARNGSKPASGETPHWFFGDGMAHGVRLGAGRAEWYRNRWVRTTMYEGGLTFGTGPPGGASNQSNVSLIWHGGRLLSSGEVGSPYELDPLDLSTRGVHDFGGGLTSSFTAHPKIDPATGNLHFFGYGFVPPYLTYSVADPSGVIVHSETVDLPRSTMIHDFAITATDVIFWDLPVVFDLEAAIAFIGDPAADVFPYRWQPDAGARVGVMPLGGPASAIRWFDIDPCYVFHGVNAFRRGDSVVLDVCRLTSMFAPDETFGGDLSLRRWTLDEVTGRVTDDIVEADDPGELPSRDPRRVGREHRYGYLVETRDNPNTVDFGGLIKHDYTTGTRTAWKPGPTLHAGEWLFVPGDDGDLADDAGWLLSFVHDEATATSDLVIVDATDVASGPVASITLPQRVPYGFHATWVPSSS
jgi:carotenoid cleavage dioxygenase